jgi:hypothetical protein
MERIENIQEGGVESKEELQKPTIHFDEDRNDFPVEVQEEFIELSRINFKKWNDALLSKDPQEVAKIYSKRHIAFLPTLSKTFIKDQEGVEKYFIHFLSKNPNGNVITGEEIIYIIDENNYTHSGFYDFEIDGARGSRIIVNARFTFGWRKNLEGEWKIVEHHSSLQPQ